ncbi:MAG TPA: flippase [Patescibacteria group bacterium]|nr:flippase [Patescibacteria group bacterium]
MAYTVTQNTSFLTVASVLQKIISFVYFTIIARIIGVENTGQYFFAIAFTTVFTVVADFGLGPVFTREAARAPEKSEKYLNTVITSKILFGIAAYLLVVLFANLLNYPALTKHLIYLSGVTMFFDNLHAGYYALFRARKNLKYEAVGLVGSQFLTLVIGTIALVLKWPLIWLIGAYTIPAFLNFLFSSYFAHQVYKLKYYFSLSKDILKWLLPMALPFALAGLLGRLYSYSDSIIMSKFLSPESLGYWSVPYKITFAFQFIPIALATSVYPVMSGLHVSEPGKIGELFQKSWRYLLILVLPLSLGIIILAEPIILHLYKPTFAPSIPVLQILMVSLIFGYLSFITTALINATNHQKVQTTLVGLALVVNLSLNFLLLPRLGIVGAALAALGSNVTLCLSGYYFSSRYAKLDHKRIMGFLLKSLGAAVIMALTIMALKTRVHYIFTIPIGAVIYFVFLFLFKGISLELLKEAKKKIFKTA